MEVQFGPNSVDEPNLLYKLQRKVKVFNTTDNLPNRGYNLVASASKYGVVFVGSPDGTLSVYYLKQLIDKDCESPQHFSVKLTHRPSHVAVSCDQEILAITGDGILSVFSVGSFQNQNATPTTSIRLDINPTTFVSSLQWNPCIPDTIAIAYFDGTLLVAQVSSKQIKKVQAKARCLCWSPKGKQLVIGNSDGTLCQYKPDLSPMKTVPAPNLFEGAPVEAVAIHWISTYQFAVVYRNAADNSRPALTIVNTPKAGQPTCLNFEDICYSMGSNRPWYYYLQGLAQWNIILSSSSNSMEIATLGSVDGANWLQWCQPDEARPELPLTDKKIENFPVGVSFDTCAIHQLPWGENETLPHMPLLHVVSQSGLLTIFNVINLNKQVAQICAPPSQLILPAAALTTDIPGETPAAPPLDSAPAPVAQVASQPKASAFGVPSQPPPQSANLPSATSQFGPPAPPSGSVFSMQKAPPSYGQVFAPGSNEPRPAATVAPQPALPTHAQISPAQPALPKPAPTQPAPAQPVKPAEPSPQAVELAKEQERANIAKANQELKKLLVKQVNDFQMELYKFRLQTWETQQQLKLDDSEDQKSVGSLLSLNTEYLRKECSLEELRGAIIQLKLELVRTCAVVAEARTHNEARDEQWTQTDPLSTKRLVSVKKLAYYVQSQLEQAHRALDYKWNEMEARMDKPGSRMIRPILDDVYQPLVKQQEILSRQQAVIRTLSATLDECEISPMLKTTSLLRSTPFKKDPLSKLSKNILNMSIEPQNKAKDNSLTNHKLDALRDMLSNHKTVKIKPVNVELRQHLEAMRLSYERSVKEKAQPASVQEPTMQSPQISFEAKSTTLEANLAPTEVKTAVFEAKPPSFDSKPSSFDSMSSSFDTKPSSFEAKPPLFESKPVLAKQTTPSVGFSPLTNAKISQPQGGFVNVARTLFADDTKQPSQPAQPKPTQFPISVPKPTSAFRFAPPTSTSLPPPASNATRSALKDLLQSKSQANETKNDAKTFMGQNICSPTSFAASTPITVAPPASKPISEIGNMLNKYQPPRQPMFGSQEISKPTPQPATKSTDTGESEKSSEVAKLLGANKDTKPVTFGVKPLASNAQNVPEIVKSTGFSFGKIDGITKLEAKPAENIAEKTKENVPEKLSEKVPAPSKPVTSQGEISKPVEFKSESSKVIEQEETTETKIESKPAPAKTTSASSIFASVNVTSPTAEKPQAAFETAASSTPQLSTVFGTPSSQPSSVNETATKTSAFEPVTTTSPAASVFASANQNSAFSATSPTTQSSSIFGDATTNASSIFASAAAATQSSSIFSKSPTSTSSSSVFGISSAQSVFGAAASKPTVFSTPTPASPSSVFGSPPTTTSVFGTAPTQATVFGSQATTQASVFGSANSQASVFASAVATTTQSSVFGTPTSPTTPQSVFGAAVAATTQASAFGTPTTTQTSIFGTPTATTQPSVFGTPTTQASVFGTPTTQASVFGTPTTQASVFGTPTPASTQASVFGTPAVTTTQSGGSLFGGTDNLFAAASISTTSAPSQPTGSIFGGGASQGSVFGSGSPSNVFGGKAAFGQPNPSAASIFSGGGATSSFGQKPATNLWGSGGNTGGSAFGAPAFGQQTTQAQSVFGAGGGSFSSSAPGGAFGSPPSQPGSVFGTPQQQTGQAFGGSPVFGSQPAFGQSAGFGQPAFGGGGFNKSPTSGFGAPAAFGGGATFGGGANFGSSSPGKMFGGGGPQPGFGTPTQSNATFESLATQNTLSFGNLAQQAVQPAPAAPTFNTSPSFTGWRS